MNSDMGKTKDSKQRLREAGAALPYSEKLAIVEELRNEKATRFPNPSSGPPSVDQSRSSEESLLLKLIQNTVEGLQRGREVMSGSEEERQIIADAEQLCVNKESASKALDALLPEGVVPNAFFFERLKNLHLRLGWSGASNQVIGILILTALDRLKLDEGEALLREMPKMPSPYFFQALESLPILLKKGALRPSFAAEWFTLLVRRIGNDLASAGFWNALGVYCDEHPDDAVAVLSCIPFSEGEDRLGIAAYILGALRSIELKAETRGRLETLEREFSQAIEVNKRSIYNRSWIETARRGALNRQELESLVERMTAGSIEEREQVYWIVTASILSQTISEDSFNFGLGWLRANVSGQIPPLAKYHVIDFAVRLAPAHREDAGKLVLLVQPIQTDHKGIWQRMEHFLVHWLQTDFLGFKAFCVDLANKNAKAWLKVLQEPQNYEWFFSELRGKDAGDMVGELIFSPSWYCRKLGLFFFDKLDLIILPSDMLAAASQDQIKIAFYELQRDLIHGRAVARYLMLLIPFVEHTDDAFQEEFYRELVLQLKNYPGACREEFEKRKEAFPILGKALDEAKRYFDALQAVRKSNISTMDVPGYRKAVRLHARRFSNEISKKAEEMSVFMQLFKKVVLPYGKAWRTFNDGKLGGASAFHEVSSSIEVPRMEIIDPEEMALRRLHASVKIQQLSTKPELESEEE